MRRRFTLTRRALVAGGAAAALPLASTPSMALDECTVRRGHGPWATSMELKIPAQQPRPLKVADMIDEQEIRYGNPYGGANTVFKPDIGFQIVFSRQGDAFRRASLRVSGYGYSGSPAYPTAVESETPTGMTYWISADEPAGPVQMALSYQDGDKPYITFTHEDGRTVRCEGEFKKASTPYTTINYVAPEFSLPDMTVVGQIVFFLRKSSRVGIETGIIHANGRRVALVRTALSTGGLDGIYADMMSSFNERLTTFDLEKCRGGGCFLTTACCAVMGRADDGFELRTLRAFRDGWLSRQSFGPAMIEEYYRIAPAISRRLLASPHGRKQLRALYWRTILPCAAAIRLGLNGLAYRLYRRMMAALAR